MNMYCGNQRHQVSNQADRTSDVALDATSAGAALAPAPVRQRLNRVMFEYQGATSMTVVSPLTRRAYHFAHPGARIAVDPRDTPWLTFTPYLARAL